MRACALLAALLVASCGGGSGTPRPSPVSPSPTAPLKPTFEVSGRVVASVTAEPLAGVALNVNGIRTSTDGTGAFRFEWDPNTAAASGRVTLTSTDIVTRSLTVRLSEPGNVTLDVIRLGHGFDLEYYRKIVRDGMATPSLRTLRRWTRAPRIYLKTVDEAGNPIDESTLARTTMALLDDALAWTGGRFGIAEVVRGTESREGASGWMTVKWPNPANEGDNCGRAQVGLDGGWIELNYLNPECACGDSRVGAGLVRHELGHAFGFYHTDDLLDIMQPRLPLELFCAGKASARERYHAAIAYGRQVGNVDLDDDPVFTAQRGPAEPIVVVD